MTSTPKIEVVDRLNNELEDGKLKPETVDDLEALKSDIHSLYESGGNAEERKDLNPKLAILNKNIEKHLAKLDVKQESKDHLQAILRTLNDNYATFHHPENNPVGAVVDAGTRKFQSLPMGAKLGITGGALGLFVLGFKKLSAVTTSAVTFSWIPQSFKDSFKDNAYGLLSKSDFARNYILPWLPGGETWLKEKMKSLEDQIEKQKKTTDELIPKADPVLRPSVSPADRKNAEVSAHSMVQSIQAERALIKNIPEKRQKELKLDERIVFLESTMAKFAVHLKARDVEKKKEITAYEQEFSRKYDAGVNLLGIPLEIKSGLKVELRSSPGKNPVLVINDMEWNVVPTGGLSLGTINVTKFQRNAAGGFNVVVDVMVAEKNIFTHTSEKPVPFELLYTQIEKVMQAGDKYVITVPPDDPMSRLMLFGGCELQRKH